MKTKSLTIFLIFITLTSFSQPYAPRKTKVDESLTVKLEKAMKGFHGKAGVYVRNLKTNRIAQVNADSIYPTASMVKVPIMCGIFDKLNKGEIKYDQMLL